VRRTNIITIDTIHPIVQTSIVAKDCEIWMHSLVPNGSTHCAKMCMGVGTTPYLLSSYGIFRN
jgi:hypothetical protein